MKKLFPVFIFSLLMGSFSMAWNIDSFDVSPSSGTHLSNVYDAANPNSLVMTGINPTRRECCVFDATTINIAVSVEGGSSTVPSAGSHEVTVPAGVGRCIKTAGSSRLYIRSKGADLTAGEIVGDCE